jgi:ABC-type transport system involved in multi-copper enzyme maturation permease subunit
MRFATRLSKNELMLSTAVLSRELRTRMRGRRAAIIITVYLVALAGAGAAFLHTFQNQFQYDPGSLFRFGAQVFTVLSIVQLSLVVFIVPGLTGGAVAGERDRQTLDILLSSQVSSAGIIVGKLLSSLTYVVLLLIAALPIFSLAFLFGGVSPRQIVVVFLVSLATAITLGSMGIALSTWLRRGQMATIAAYAITFFLSVGTLAIAGYIEANTGSGTGVVSNGWRAVHIPLIFNPFSGLLSVLPNMGVLFTNQGSQWTGLAFWQATLIADAVIVVACTWLSIVALRPGHRWSRFRRGSPSPAPIEAQS